MLGIFFTFTYRYYKENAFEEARRDSENVCASINSSVKTQLDSISAISMNIVYSNAIKENFKQFSRNYQISEQTPDSQVASRKNALAIHDIVTAVIGAYQSASQVNIYTMDGSYVEAGYWMRTGAMNLEELSWYGETVKANGHKYFTHPIVRADLPAKGANQNSKQFISITRTFFDRRKEPEGIVEVIQDCDAIFSLASQMEDLNPDSRIYIYNSRQELVYPYNRKEEGEHFSIIQKEQIPEGRGQMINAPDAGAVLYTWTNLPDYDWTVVLIKPKSAVFGALKEFQLLFLRIVTLSILLILVICFFISKKLTQPLEKLTAAARKITINRVLDENKVRLTSADSSIAEIAALCDSLRTMYESLRSTTQEYLLSQSEEIRAKLQATQSLINPHFLYNSLTSISIMAEENMNHDIILMCQSLCDYFRYISSSGQMFVTLEEEFFYTEKYLECMKLRFGEELEYNSDLEEGTSKLYIPKLIVQPIVENAFKHAFNMSPPWKLNLSSHLEKDRWIVKIMDNGHALSDQKKKELLESFHRLNTSEELKSLKIGGMGLKNVYLRLKLLYGEKAVFQIENSLPQKTIFILGGPIYRSLEECHERHPRI